MSLTFQIPIDESPDARAHVEQLGLRHQLDAMLEHTKQTISDLRAISVQLDPYTSSVPTVLILAEIRDPGPDGPGMADESAELRWDHWARQTFPREINRHFCFMAMPGTSDDAR